MTTRYSKTTGTFYPFDNEYGANLPSDVVEVSTDDFNAVMARPVGATFVVDTAGKVTVKPALVIPFSDISSAHLNGVRITREAILNRLTGLGFAALVANDTVTAAAISVARQGLLDITKAASVTSATTLDGLKAAVLSEYRTLTAVAPLTVQKAFQGVDK